MVLGGNVEFRNLRARSEWQIARPIGARPFAVAGQQEVAAQWLTSERAVL